MDEMDAGAAPMAAAPPPVAAPNLANPTGWKAALPLLVALPAILKGSGGAQAAAAFLSGVQRARGGDQALAQQNFQNQRLVAADQRAAQQTQEAAAYRRSMLEGQQRQQRQALLTNALKTLEGADPEAIAPLVDLFSAQLQSAGISDLSPLTKAAAVYGAPSRVKKRAVERYVGKLQKEHGADWAASLWNASHTIPGLTDDAGQPRTVTTQELLALGGTQTPTMPGKPKSEPDERRVFLETFAQERGFKDYASMPSAQQAEAMGAYQRANPPMSVAFPKPEKRGLSSQQEGRVQAAVRSFDAMPVVKNTQKIAEANQFVQALDTNTTNPADDQALIYAFAKAMDPDSVVREGEYATVQKYAQSWAESFGFNVARLFSNTTFLTPQARQNMKRTIQNRFKAAKSQYLSIRKSKAAAINKITGNTDGDEWLTDYQLDPPSGATGQAPMGLSYEDYVRSRRGEK